jgi:hypothetical protein
MFQLTAARQTNLVKLVNPEPAVQEEKRVTVIQLELCLFI